MSLAPFYRGDTKEYPFSFTFNGAPVDISGKKLYFTLKTAIGDPDPGVLQKILGPFSGPAAVAGTGELVLTSTDTAALAPGKYLFDFELVDPAVSPPHVTTLAKGTVTVLADVTITAT
jgi:hypothetical protein